MSSRGKRKDEDVRESDDESETQGPVKKAAKPSDSSNEPDDIVICNISKNRRVSVRNWNGRIWVDIREFYVKDGKTLPGKKGISLSIDQWNTLRSHAEDIDKAINDLS